MLIARFGKIAVAAPFLIAFLPGTPASAEQSLTPLLDLRAEYESSALKTSDDTKTDFDDQHTDRFLVKYARFGAKGKLDPDTSFRIRFSLNKNATKPENEVDNTTSNLEWAFVERSFGEHFSLGLGKFELFNGSLENSHSGFDQYVYSYTSDLAPLTYDTGALFSLKFAGQTLAMQVANSHENESEQTPKAFSSGVQWQGSFAGGMVEPLASYVTYPRARSKAGVKRDDASSTSMWGVGVRVNAADLTAELETLSAARNTYSTYSEDATETVVPKESRTGYVLQLNYKVMEGKILPLLKVTSDSGKVDGKDDVASTRLALGAEWRPISQNYRFHAVVTSVKDEAETGSKTVESTMKVILGTALRY